MTAAAKSPAGTTTSTSSAWLTMRQLKDARFFFHNGSFTNVRDVVQYFNAGVPQNAQSGAASTLSPRFTNPRRTWPASRPWA